MTPQPELTAITTELALRTPQRPDEEDWAAARDRAMHLFGFMPPNLARGRLVAMFVQDLSRRARQHRDAAHRLVDELERHADRLGLDRRADSGRLHTAHAAADLLDGLDSRHQDIEIVRQLARADLGGPPERAGKSIRSAEELVQALRGAAWDTFELLADFGEPWAGEAQAIFAALRQAANDDELTTPLAPVLHRTRNRATELVRRANRLAPRVVHGDELEEAGPGGRTGVGPRPLPQQIPSSDGAEGPADGGIIGQRTWQRGGTGHGDETGQRDEGEQGSAIASSDDLESTLDTLREVARRNPGRDIEIAWRVRR